MTHATTCDGLASASRLDWLPEHEMLRATARRFFIDECQPHREAWESDGMVPAAIWRRAGELGLLCPRLPVELGGSGGDILCSIALIEEQVRADVVAPMFSLHSDIVAPYIAHYGTAAQQARLLPRLASGDWIAAIAMTEPGAGSDLRGMRTRARRDGTDWVVNGAKTFISHGCCANLIVLAAQTDAGISLFAVEADGLDGLRRSAPLEKVGQWAADTAELFFDDVRLPADALLGAEGGGFAMLRERLIEERLLTAVSAVAMAEQAIEHTLAYTRDRKAFGRSILDFQNSRFKLAEARTDVDVARIFVEECILRFADASLDEAQAAMAKYWTTDLQNRVIDDCLQLHGGYGYMLEYPIARLWLDSRITRIYAGTNEIMKEVIGRSL
ncbi:acyl-CoA dehydrogenase family protein [Hephaestia sp. GCM10023244]|uniref:acyl-CoA dehydrogenase family protein n=1 Tax=unclassified Hephaestia TaxID=2631281 RepID=UPI002077087D|nr:acyl-CoA dehydrogenase family protein [Hephaestia sp. MAHUQ-44]MCM8729814.1 acyl-CoA dehydrogenase family protein [Hephaestia sp. MAHUQ-44]